MVAASCPNFGFSIFSNPVVLNAFTTRAATAHRATCSPPDPPEWSIPGHSFAGFVQSISTLPETSAPICLSTSGTDFQGTASVITSAAAAASCDDVLFALLAAFSSCSTSEESGAREPNITSCPARAHPVPSAPPTWPVPITAIFISCSRGLLFLCRRGLHDQPRQFCRPGKKRRMARLHRQDWVTRRAIQHERLELWRNRAILARLNICAGNLGITFLADLQGRVERGRRFRPRLRNEHFDSIRRCIGAEHIAQTFLTDFNRAVVWCEDHVRGNQRVVGLLRNGGNVFAVSQQICGHINEPLYFFRNRFGGLADHGSRHAVANQHRRSIYRFTDLFHISIKRNSCKQCLIVAMPRQLRDCDRVALLAKILGYHVPAPCSQPRSVYQHEVHNFPFRWCVVISYAMFAQTLLYCV